MEFCLFSLANISSHDDTNVDLDFHDPIFLQVLFPRWSQPQ
jgi:hypothetical protein